MIKNTVFGGERPIVEPLNLSHDQASFCQDCYLHTSGLDPLRSGKFVDDGYAPAKTLFRAGDKFIYMSTWTDFVRAPHLKDKFNRIYYTQDANPGLYVTTCADLVNDVSGVNLSNLKPPTDAPTPVIIRGDVLTDVAFAITRTDAGGVESGPSATSAVVSYADADDTINLKIDATSDANITTTNIYAVVNGVYYLQRSVPATTASVNFTPFTLDTSNAVTLGAVDASIDAPTPTVVRDTTHIKTTNFLVTYVSIRDEETTNSPISISVDYEDGVDCLELGLPATNNPDIAFMRIYMEVGGDYYLLAEVPATQTQYNVCPLDDDFITNGNNDPNSIIGSVFSTENYDPAPEDIIGLHGLPNGSLAGFANDDACGGITGVVYVSVPYQPHAWPTEYRFPIRYKIVALRNVPEGLLVLTEGKHSLITGSTPDVMDEHEIETQHSCRDKRSALEIGDSVVWSSPDGVAIYGGRNIKVISLDVWAREQWQDLVPEAMLFGFYEGRLIIYAIESEKAFIYNLARHDIIRLSEFNVHALLYDVEEDALFLARGDNLERFNEGAILEGEWISKPHIVPAARTFNSMRISPEGETQVSLYRNNNELDHADYLPGAFWSKAKDHQRPFRVGSGGRMREICIGFKLTGKKRLRFFELAEDMRELV